ncbi:hypothetical protein [Pseudomonas allokribbensis]|uniref:hypothetical protein n=1 Tax=Pseudomonas allokribbensis TaxID=2774460 RepID=UPI001FC8CD29|nr:hypothetical protein [Pseudomonas allokribbensis]
MAPDKKSDAFTKLQRETFRSPSSSWAIAVAALSAEANSWNNPCDESGSKASTESPCDRWHPPLPEPGIAALPDHLSHTIARLRAEPDHDRPRPRRPRQHQKAWLSYTKAELEVYGTLALATVKEFVTPELHKRLVPLFLASGLVKDVDGNLQVQPPAAA